MSKIIVELTPLEVERALCVARAWHKRVRERGYASGAWERTLEQRKHHDEVGSIGEEAFAKWRGIYRDPRFDGFAGPDFGTHIQVRATETWGGHLYIYKGNPDEHIYVLVVGKPPQLGICGWVLGAEAKCNEWWEAFENRSDGGLWSVPQAALHPMDELYEAAEKDAAA